MREPKTPTFEQVMKLVDQLTADERGRVYKHLQFRFCDDLADQVRKQLNEQRAAQGLQPATDDDLHDALDDMRSPEEWEDLRRETQKGIDELDRGEGIPGEQ